MTRNEARFSNLLEMYHEVRSIAQIARRGDSVKRATALTLLEAMVPDVNGYLIDMLGPTAHLNWRQRDPDQMTAIESFASELEFAVQLLAPFFPQQFHEAQHAVLPSLPTSF
jgi:hypothetical protein